MTRAGGASEGYLARAVFATVAICGATTILQGLRVWRIGTGRVVTRGATGSFIAVCVVAVKQGGPAAANGARALVLIESSRRPTGGEDEPEAQSDAGFVEAVAAAGEAGLPVSVTGLFVGGSRRRIALLGYPFQRRRCWPAKTGGATAASV